MKERKPVFPVKPAALILVFFLMVVSLVVVGRILTRLDCFMVKEIISSKPGLAELSYLKGRNIFSIDVRKESEFITGLYPSYKEIRLIRVLPNRLFVDFVKRKPLAYVKLYRYFCVDEDAILFDMPQQLEETELPLIVGLETRIFGPKPGKRYTVRELALALQIIKEARLGNMPKTYKIKVIDVANASNASFFISEGLEVKIGHEDIRQRIAFLINLLAQSKQEIANIKYIDLRFKEPVIKLKAP